jgi:hypothetical protein
MGSHTPSALERKRHERAELDRKRQAEISARRDERQAAEEAAEAERIAELLRPAREAAGNRTGPLRPTPARR